MSPERVRSPTNAKVEKNNESRSVPMSRGNNNNVRKIQPEKIKPASTGKNAGTQMTRNKDGSKKSHSGNPGGLDNALGRISRQPHAGTFPWL